MLKPFVASVTSAKLRSTLRGLEKFALDGLLRPCRRMAVGLLLPPESGITIGDPCMVHRPMINGQSDDEICNGIVLVMLAR